MIGAVIGATSVITTYSMVYILRYMPVAIVTPITSGGGILFTTLVSSLRYKEKVTLKKGIGLAITMISIIFML